MKYLITITLLFLTACESKTEFGKCIGLDGDRKPELVYKVSITNVVVGLLFWELITPPVVVLVDQLYCPVGKK